MAKETIVKENPVIDALKKLKEEEMELTAKLKPVQELSAPLRKFLTSLLKRHLRQQKKHQAMLLRNCTRAYRRRSSTVRRLVH